MKKRLSIILEGLIVFLLSIMLLSVLWGVCSRYILADQSSWTDELARFMLIWVSIFGAAYISGKNAHIAIDLLPASISEKNKLRLEMITGVVIGCFVFAVFLVGGLRYVYVSFKLEQASAALEVPMGYVYLVLPISGLLIIYFKFLDVIKTFWKLKLIK